MEPKINNDVKQANAGFPKMCNHYGNGGSIVGLSIKHTSLEVNQRSYSTRSCAVKSSGTDNEMSITKLDSNKFTGLYKQMMNRNFIMSCYDNIKYKPGNITPGTDESTLDGFSIRDMDQIIGSLKDESFVFKPSRRVIIPKANGKLRPLSIASPRDKIVQEAIRQILNAIYDPLFIGSSHGFRPGRSCHSALKDISTWSGITWVIEGDIKSFFDNVDLHILESLLRRKIQDQQFIDLY